MQECVYLPDTDFDGIIDDEDRLPDMLNADRRPIKTMTESGMSVTLSHIFPLHRLLRILMILSPLFPWKTTWFLKTPGRSLFGQRKCRASDPVVDGWASRMGVVHSYASYREVGNPTWSNLKETVWIWTAWVLGPLGLVLPCP